MERPVLLDAILALAAAHTAVADSPRLYGSAVSGLRRELASGVSPIAVLLATMIICIYETAEGEPNAIVNTHLRGFDTSNSPKT